MKRRTFLQGTMMPGVLVAVWPVAALARYDAIPYQRGLLRELQDDGALIIVNFTAAWSPTSRLKRDTLARIKADTPAYARSIQFVDIDWDTFGTSRMAERMRIDRHATLVAFRGRTEIARIEATFNEPGLRDFLDRVMAAG